jgi:hypothetical protein
MLFVFFTQIEIFNLGYLKPVLCSKTTLRLHGAIC